MTSLDEKCRSHSLDPLCVKGAEWFKLSPGKRRQQVDKAFRFWRNHGFPHYRLTKLEVSFEFSRVLGLDEQTVFFDGDLHSSNAGLRLANAFQPHMWRARV